MHERVFAGRISTWISTGLGIGLVTPAPGTFGGLWGIPLAWVLGMLPFREQVTILVLLVFAGLVICTQAIRAMGVGKDPGEIVYDEIIALPIVFLGVPHRGMAVMFAGYILFRIIDITKPVPIKRLEDFPWGFGIMADDTLAGIYACGLLHALLWLDKTMAWDWFAVPVGLPA